MPKFAGSLRGGIEKAMQEGLKLGVLIVDEQGAPGKDEDNTQNQIAVIQFAKEKSLPIWVIEFNPGLAKSDTAETREKTKRTRNALLDMLPDAKQLIKPQMNAFVDTDLDTQLKGAELKGFVIMGYASNCCVRLTAVGGAVNPHSATPTIQVGGTGHDYKVLSCQQVLHGGAANWSENQDVRFYESA